MLTVVLAVAVVGIALLAAAVLTDNTVVALVVIALAAVGLVLLARDWLQDRGHPDSTSEEQAEPDEASNVHVAESEEPAATPLEPEEFEPDVPYEEPDVSDDNADDETRETEKRKP